MKAMTSSEPARPGWRLSPLLRLTVALDGVSVSDLEQGSYLVTVTAPGHAAARAAVVLDRDRELVLELSPARRYHVRVLLGVLQQQLVALCLEARDLAVDRAALS